VPVKKLSRYGAEFPAWGADGSKVYFALGKALFTYDLTAAAAASLDSASKPAAKGPAYEPSQSIVKIVVPKDRPTGVVVLKGARLITMKGKEIIAKGDVVVNGNRIAAVGPSGSVKIPSGA
jgi:hypothetical protein